MPSDRVQEKITNHVEIFWGGGGGEMQKNASIMQKHTGICGDFNS